MRWFKDESCGESREGTIVQEQPGLFTPVKVGALELPSRIVMSPMTRIRSGEGCVPSERMARYDEQRASAGFVITEGTHPGPLGRGYTFPPGPHTEEQAAGWSIRSLWCVVWKRKEYPNQPGTRRT